MDTDFITILATNLGILLIASWAFGLVLFSRLLKEKQRLENAENSSQSTFDGHKGPADMDFPLDSSLEDLLKEESTDFLGALNHLNSQFKTNEKQLKTLAQIQSDQRASGTSENTSNLEQQEEAQTIVGALQSDFKNSQHIISQLEKNLRESQNKEARIAILEEKERNFKKKIEALDKSQEQASTLAEGLKKSKEKNKKLQNENDQLKNNIKELANASESQREIIRQVTDELEKANKLEDHQRKIIKDLEEQLQEVKSTGSDSQASSELEAKLDGLNDTLERTIREKEFIETHLLEMDKALENAKETEKALEKARKEIENLEMCFPELTSDDATETNQALKRFPVSEEDNPQLYRVIKNNRLFGILREFWTTLDAPPLRLTQEESIARPKELNLWVKTSIHDKEFFVIIGTNQELNMQLAQAMFDDDSLKEGELKDALGELGNVIAGTLANELDPSYIVGTPNHLEQDELEIFLQHTAVVSELLLIANRQPLYIALIKPEMNH